jgi:hypothetical protein
VSCGHDKSCTRKSAFEPKSTKLKKKKIVMLGLGSGTEALREQN